MIKVFNANERVFTNNFGVVNVFDLNWSKNTYTKSKVTSLKIHKIYKVIEYVF